jgi:glycosyltransferase involved in cell wall biosynthesis
VNPNPRVAFFTDSFHEINGVAHTSRHFDAFVRRRGLPFLNVHAGPETNLTVEGPVSTLELKRGSVGFSLESDMSFDLLFLKHKRATAEVVKKFGAELIHITGPSDVGILGAYLAHDLKLPLVASWHTNLHEFGAHRLGKTLSFVPSQVRDSITGLTEHKIILAACLRFYRLARVILAPNLELVEMLHERTGRPSYLMQRGVDTILFCPEKRNRQDEVLTIGYVGRLSPEKSVRFLREVENALIAAGVENHRLLIVGDGHEREWLEANLRRAEFTGVLAGEALATAYANMDIFAFPSHTDTFGNVVLEAMASGLVPVVTSSGGPKFLVADGVTGFVAQDSASFVQYVVQLAKDHDLRARMRTRAREFALCRYWHRIFDQVYDAYHYCLNATIPSPFRAPHPPATRSPLRVG